MNSLSSRREKKRIKDAERRNRRLTFDQFISLFGDKAERKWQRIHDDYGDGAPLLSAYKNQLWREYMAGEIDENLDF